MAASDPVVQSIRVAMALNERFGDLAAAPGASFANKAGMSRTLNEDELALRIGEAQQIYPEIWRHLDDARAALVARGVDTALYDAFRAAHGDVKLGVPRVDVEVVTTGYPATIYRSVKTAVFNDVGHRQAKEACRALMAAMPEVDWAAIELAEAAQTSAAIHDLTSGRRRAMIIAAAIAVLVLGYLVLR